MDDPTIEASSLSAITKLAFNPPANAHAKHTAPLDALTLYIARVPGRHDVFLTTMKPRDRVVSAQDVHSSLYYVHVNDAEDHTLLYQRRPTSADTDASQLPVRPQHTIKRKPMIPPRSPRRDSFPREHILPSGPQDRTSSTGTTRRIARKPVLPERTNVNNSGIQQPRPLPPTPAEAPFDESIHESNVRLLRNAEYNEDINPYLLKCEADLSSCVPPPGTLTLIRRDPGTGEQWNVAHVYDSLIRGSESPNFRRSSFVRSKKLDSSTVFLDISNPGYNQFSDLDICDSASSLSSYSDEAPFRGGFRRCLQTSKSWDGVADSDPATLSGTARYGDTSPLARSESMRFSRRSRGGYAFKSPWGGACEFSTGATGKSLKCRHSLGQAVGDVSELRFNLPTIMRKERETVHNKRSSTLLHRRQLSEQDDDCPTIIMDENGDIDLSLGQEFAGGGFGGRQAKLGKLIVHPEGLKMLDLVIAANIGLWWRAYRKT